MPATNQLVISGQISAREVLRYTPGGIPTLKLRLSHQSRQPEAERLTEVKLVLEVLAMGELALRLAALPPDQALTVKGHLVQGRHQRGPLTLVADQYKIYQGD